MHMHLWLCHIDVMYVVGIIIAFLKNNISCMQTPFLLRLRVVACETKVHGFSCSND